MLAAKMLYFRRIFEKGLVCELVKEAVLGLWLLL